MAFKVHTIKKYNYSFDARAGGPGRLQLWGETGKIAEIRHDTEARSSQRDMM
jgi:hypothetical protein